MVRTPHRLVALLVALAAAGCGSSGSSSSRSRAARDATRALQRALTAISHRPFDETFRETARLHVAGVPRAKAARLDAALGTAGFSGSGVVHFVSARMFGARISSSRSGTEYVKVTGGRTLVSRDGVHYFAPSATVQQALTILVHSGFSFVNHGARNVEDKGQRLVNGTSVEEYTGTFAGAAVQAQLGSLVRLPPATSVGIGTTTVDVDRATGLPLHIVDAITLTTDLAAVRPGLRGRLITAVTSSRQFRFAVPP